MYRRTVPCMRMASTKGGMRRILKYKGSVPNYIRQAVETGVYRSNSELEQVLRERRESADDLRVIMRRFRQNIVRGSNIADYPVEYQILQQHPPVPDPPRIPKKLARRLKQPQPNPTERLVEKYLKRHERQEEQNNVKSYQSNNDIYSGNGPDTTEEYYRRLLGVPPPQIETTLGQKPANIQKAYAAAIKNYQLQRTEGLSEEEALKRVDEILATEDEREKQRSRTVATQIQQIASQERSTSTSDGTPLPKILYKKAEAAASASTTKEGTETDEEAKPTEEGETNASLNSHIQTIFGTNPRIYEGMMRWSERLEQVPYREWTIGASVALDHWIARNLLGLSEETWLLLLEGHYDDDFKTSESDLLQRGRDIIVVRETLFPETIIDRDAVQREKQQQQREAEGDALSAAADTSDEVEDGQEREKTIEELLASIGGSIHKEMDVAAASSEGDAAAKKVDVTGSSPEDDLNELDRKVSRIIDELQEWRRVHVSTPYADWSDGDKERFGVWMKEYTSTLVSDAERGSIDLEATRTALLSEPPLPPRDETDAFWDTLQDESSAVQLLERLRQDGPPSNVPILQQSFWDLSYDQQLQRLMNLGALRPLLDEYVRESDRTKFLQRYADALLEGVELEHLVPDPDGPIRVSDLSASILGALGEESGVRVPKDARFRLEMRPYKSSDNMSAEERTRIMYLAWNQHKAGRARYEEKLFQTGRLGLRYTDPIPDEDALDEDDK